MLLVLLAGGCRPGYWRPAPVVPDQMIAATHPKRIRVTLSDSSVLVLKDPEVSGDSIAGTSDRTRVSVPSARIVRSDVPPGLEAAEPMISTWRTERRAPQEVIAQKRPERVRLTFADRTRLELAHPVSVGDSIIGFVSETRTAVASAGIVRTEIRTENSLKAIAGGVLFVSAVAAVYFALCRNGPDCVSGPTVPVSRDRPPETPGSSRPP